MGKLFSNISAEGVEESVDRLGGRAEPFATDIYPATIKVAYAGESAKGAQNVTVVFDINGTELKETVYFTKVTGETFYLDKDDKTKKMPLPGFTLLDDLCLLATEEGLLDQAGEEKIVKIYDYTAKKEVPTPVNVLTGLTGAKVALGVLRVVEDKEKKNDAGVYVKVDNGETRTVNEIDKVFHAETMRTVNEYKQGVQTPEFHDAWLKRNRGNDRNKSSNRGGATAGGQQGTGRPGGLGGGAASTEPKRKLFGK